MTIVDEPLSVQPIRVIVADDHPAMRQIVCQLLAGTASITVVGQAANGQQALQLIKELNPDVAILDAVMPSIDGIHATNRVHSGGHSARVLIISVHESYPLALFAMRQGAKGYVPKSMLYEELVTAVEVIYKGQEFISPTLLDQSKKESEL